VRCILQGSYSAQVKSLSGSMDGWMGSPTSQPASQPDGLHCTSRGFTQSYFFITYSAIPYHTAAALPPLPPPPPPTTAGHHHHTSDNWFNQSQIRPLGFDCTVSSLSNVCYWIGSYSSFFFLSSLVLAWLTSTLSRCPALHYLLVHLLPVRTYGTSTVPYRIKKPCGFFFFTPCKR